LETIKKDADELYILGDLFDYWIGDDGIDLLGHRRAAQLLQSVSEQGIKIFFMHGNRDFLVGEHFLGLFSATLLSDPSVIRINGQNVLLMHGDSLCTQDVEHQRYRQIVLSSQWQEEILKLAPEERLHRALDMRKESSSNKQNKASEIMDVDLNTVNSFMHNCAADVMIHGHVHKPGIHEVRSSKVSGRRYVLGDWDGGSDGVIRVNADGQITLYTPD